MNSDNKGIVEPPANSLAIPMVPIGELKELTAYVAEVKKTLMQKDKDYVIDFQGRQYTSRSGFAKLSQGFNLSDDEPIVKKLWNIDMIGEETKEYSFTHYIKKQVRTETFSTKIFGFETWIRVVNVDSGRYAWGEGACTIDELSMTDNLSPKWYHRALGTAKTRAWNRAVSNYVGSAEVSAEEMGLSYSDETESPPATRRQAHADVNIVDFMKPVMVKLPDVALIDELNKEDQEYENQWHRATELTADYLVEARLNPEDFNIDVDPVKIAVSPRKAIPEDMQSSIEGIMQHGGFLPTLVKKVKGWRLNKKDVTG